MSYYRSRRTFPPILLVGAIAAVVLALIVIIVFAVRYRKTESVIVRSIHWELSINVEQFLTVRQESWDLPGDARNVTTTWEYHHSERYISGSHEVCSTTGSGAKKTRSCHRENDYSSRPVYMDKYHYDVDRWQVVKVPKNQGTDHTIAWPDVSDIADAHEPPHIGDMRTGMRISRFQLTFQNRDGKTWDVDVTEEVWRQFDTGNGAELELNIFGTVIGIHRPGAW